MAGIGIGFEFYGVAAPEGSPDQTARTFSTNPRGLMEMAKCLKCKGARTIAMEASGCHWVAVLSHLEEAGFDVALINPSAVAGIAGKESDVEGCQWIRDLYSRDLVSAFFVPAKMMTTPQELIHKRAPGQGLHRTDQ